MHFVLIDYGLLHELPHNLFLFQCPVIASINMYLQEGYYGALDPVNILFLIKASINIFNTFIFIIIIISCLLLAEND